MVALAACATPLVVPELPPGPPPGVEGRYRGTARLVRASTSTCPRSGPRVLNVSGGTLTLSYTVSGRVRQPLTAEIRSDGRIEASDGVGTMEGRIGGGVLDVTIASAPCENYWHLTQVN